MPLLDATQLAMKLPPWRRVTQHFPSRALASVEQEVRAQLSKPEIAACVKPGMRVAVAVGSRGIAKLPAVVGTLVAVLRERGATPFIVPSMGSHGGATAQGQIEVLHSLGITEAAVGAPIRSSMETVHLGQVLDGADVLIDRIAHTEADAIVPVARVKPHTGFRGPVESGLHKMLGLGLGKHAGANTLHSYPLEGFTELVPVVGQFILQHAKVPFGLAIVEDAHEQPAIIEAVAAAAFAEADRALLKTAKDWFPKLPFAEVDVLLVQEFGKNISGMGMDPNVTGRFSSPTMAADVSIGRVVVLDLTPETGGNATGIGLADIISARAAGKIDWNKTYTNHVTARTLAGAKQPLVAKTDHEALLIALATTSRVVPERARIVWIRNTLELGTLWVSAALWAQLDATKGLTVAGEPSPMSFDPHGTLHVEV